VVIVFSSVAVGLRWSALMWTSFLLAPLAFQYTVGKRWRHLRPKVMLEYLAARSAARRYAFAHQGRDLSISFLFRGTIEPDQAEDGFQDDYDAQGTKRLDRDVWIALFPDAVVFMSEGIRGAVLEYHQPLDDKLTVTPRSVGTDREYSSTREIHFAYSNKRTNESSRFTLRSRHPAALIVFEKKLLQYLGERLKPAKVALPREETPRAAVSKGWTVDEELNS
jgi:hypothetical protein